MIFNAFPWGRNCFVYEAEGGHARVARGRTLGIVPPVFKKEEFIISSRVGRFKGSIFNILVIKLRAESDIGTFSGKP